MRRERATAHRPRSALPSSTTSRLSRKLNNVNRVGMTMPMHPHERSTSHAGRDCLSGWYFPRQDKGCCTTPKGGKGCSSTFPNPSVRDSLAEEWAKDEAKRSTGHRGSDPSIGRWKQLKATVEKGGRSCERRIRTSEARLCFPRDVAHPNTDTAHISSIGCKCVHAPQSLAQKPFCHSSQDR